MHPTLRTRLAIAAVTLLPGLASAATVGAAPCVDDGDRTCAIGITGLAIGSAWYDVAFVRCGNDPGLREARESVRIPVVGMTEAATDGFKAYLALRGHVPNDPLAADARARLASKQP